MPSGRGRASRRRMASGGIAAPLGLFSAVLRLLLGLVALRLGALGAELGEPRLKKRGPRLGQLQRAKAMDALLEIVPTGFVALAGKGGLVLYEVRRRRAVLREGLYSLQSLAHRLLGLGAFLGDCCGVVDQRRAVGAPKPAGTGLAIGGLEDAGGDLRGHQRRAVQDVEGDRAGRNVGLESLHAVGTSDVRSFDRLLADDIDEAALRGIRNALPGKLQLVDRHCLVVAGNLEKSRLAVEKKRALDEARDAGRGGPLRVLGGRPRVFGFGGRGCRSLRRGRSCARES